MIQRRDTYRLLQEECDRYRAALERLRNPMGEPKSEEAVLVQIEVAKIASEALGYE